MNIQTTRFGEIEIDGSRIMRFAEGILGFPDYHDYALLQTNTENCFFWLQSIECANLAFVVCDPLLFVPDYQVPVKAEDLKTIDLENLDNAQVMIIVNKVGQALTGNLQGPLVVNATTCQARQLVLSEKRYSTRHPLMELRNKQPQSEQQVSQPQVSQTA
ncbi:MAG: flagellar assembly protein FliW [Sedimentisphaerales bacterium]|nr:flagellar assembly protein FliW [Sedimentisphaerales bacterium]MBN2842642.1 flagellar assembly protein FliW [Sedimentisphaerales bacterium]